MVKTTFTHWTLLIVSENVFVCVCVGGGGGGGGTVYVLNGMRNHYSCSNKK